MAGSVTRHVRALDLTRSSPGVRELAGTAPDGAALAHLAPARQGHRSLFAAVPRARASRAGSEAKCDQPEEQHDCRYPNLCRAATRPSVVEPERSRECRYHSGLSASAGCDYRAGSRPLDPLHSAGNVRVHHGSTGRKRLTACSALVLPSVPSGSRSVVAQSPLTYTESPYTPSRWETTSSPTSSNVSSSPSNVQP